MAYWGVALMFVVAIGETALYSYLRSRNNKNRNL